MQEVEKEGKHRLPPAFPELLHSSWQGLNQVGGQGT